MSGLLRWTISVFTICAALCVASSTASAQAACAAAWSSGQVYTAGNQASLAGTNYQANWWTQGEDPSTHNGGPGSGQPWTNIGACSGGGGGGGGGGTPIVQLFEHCNFTGWSASFTTTGAFNTADVVSRGGVDNGASAVRIATGFKATLFANNQQSGTAV